jgi:hypothetical protein
MTRVFAMTCLAGMVAFVGLARADTHHDAHKLLGDQLKKDGKHELHTEGDHTAHAHSKGGKIAKVEVVHKTKGAVAVTKYKSAKKYHAQANPGVEHHYVSVSPDDAGDECGGAIVFVGWGYTVNGVVIIYWFPVAIVIGGPDGAVVYAG